MKLILILRGLTLGSSPQTVGNGTPVGTWKWSEVHKAYIWGGRELTGEEFNEWADKVIDHATSNGHWNFPITVRAIIPKRDTTKARAALAKKRQAQKVK